MRDGLRIRDPANPRSHYPATNGRGFMGDPLRMNTLTLSTTTIHYVDRGRGLPVVLVHGFPLDHTMWSAQIDALASRVRVIAPDLRGFGRSPLAPGDESRGVSMERYADDLAELLDALAIREPIVLVGFSMGGYVAWQFVRKYPQRLRALVPCDTRAAADSDEARAGRLKMAEHIAEWGSGGVAEMMGPKLFAPQSFARLPAAVAEVRSVVERTAPAAIAAAQRGMAARPDMTVLLQLIRVPTLVIVGEHDALSPPEEMQSIAAAIPAAQCVVIPDAGHMTTMENPAAVNDALLRFLAGLAPGGSDI
jgi:pimeloyl-ACP methyl ester carboxylesterase